jgi:hypothetical protein
MEPVEEEDCSTDGFHLVNEKVYGGLFVFIWVA